MKRGLIATAALAILFIMLSSGRTLAGKDICSGPVRTGEGLVKGKANPVYAACEWKGIPYAAPPVGELRFRATQAPEPRSGVLEAYEYGPSCPQEELLTTGGTSKSFSEDCLTLNIWSPQKSGSFPVMVWIHGGAFREGAGTYQMYDGARVAAEKDVVVVTINYRIGAMGFLSLPELATEDPNNSAGNYGLLDQVQALKWVQENIAEFNGDPDKVTIFGQSAGGMSVCCLLASPIASGLFHRAIPMSGGCDTGIEMEKGYEYGREFAEQAGCEGPDVLDCLREKDVWDLVPESGNLIFTHDMGNSPHIDGHVLTDQPIRCLQEGNYNRVPVMVGHTRDEGRLYTLVFPGLSLVPKFLVKKLMRRYIGEKRTNEILEMYSFSDYKHPMGLVLAMANDAWIAQGYKAAEALAGHGTLVFLYRFDWDETRLPEKMGAFHGLDIPFVFGCEQLESRIARILAPKGIFDEARPLSNKLMSYYTNFARTGDPNGPGLKEWPAYTLQNKMRAYLDYPVSAAPLKDIEVKRYQYFSSLTLGDLLSEVE